MARAGLSVGCIALALRSALALAAPPHVAVYELPPLPEARRSTGASESDVAEQANEFMAMSVAKRAETVQESPAIITLISREQILDRGYRTLADILEDIPGFEGWRPGFVFEGLRIESFARGNRNTILLLWNGVPLNSPDDNSAFMLTSHEIPMRAIQRVEVVSGPGGVLWGANAFLGIVSVTTMRADDGAGAADAELVLGGGRGLQDTFGLSANFTESIWGGRVGVFGNLTYFTTRDASLDVLYDVLFSPFLPPQPDGYHRLQRSSGPTDNRRDHYLPLTLAVDAGPVRFDLYYPVVQRHHTEFGLGMIRGDRFVDREGAVIDGGSSTITATTAFASAAAQIPLTEDTPLTARAYYQSFLQTSERVVSATGVLSDEALVEVNSYEGDLPILRDGASRVGASVEAAHDAPARHQLVGGAEAYTEAVREKRRGQEGGFVREAVAIAPPARRVVLTAFANDRWKLGKRIQVRAGLRGLVAPGAYDPLLLASAAVLWNPRGELYLKLNGAQGFRPPPFAVVNVHDDPAINPLPHLQGNPDLRGERSQALETEATAIVLRRARQIHHVAVRFGYQLTELTDLIVERAGISINSARRVVHSAELQIDAALAGGHRLGASYFFIAGYDQDTGPLREIANHKLNLAGHFRFTPQLTGVLRTTIYGRREDPNRLPMATSDTAFNAAASSVVIDRLPPVGVIDASLRATGLWDDRFDVAMHVANAMDATYYLPDSTGDKRIAIVPVAAPGISSYISVTGRM